MPSLWLVSMAQTDDGFVGANDEMWCWKHQTRVLSQRTVLIDVVPLYHDMNYGPSALQHSTHFSPSTRLIQKIVCNIIPLLALVCLFVGYSMLVPFVLQVQLCARANYRLASLLRSMTR